jgi:hypothetical protein
MSLTARTLFAFLRVPASCGTSGILVDIGFLYPQAVAHDFCYD